MKKRKNRRDVLALEGYRFSVLHFIYEYKLKHDYSPSNREICAAVLAPDGDMLSTSVCRYHLQGLQRMGYIDFLPSQARTVHLTALGKAYMQAHSLPDRIKDKRQDVHALLKEVDELVAA